MDKLNVTDSTCRLEFNFDNCAFRYFLLGILAGILICLLLWTIKLCWNDLKKKKRKRNFTPVENIAYVEEQEESIKWPFTLSDENKTNIQKLVKEKRIHVSKCECDLEVLNEFQQIIEKSRSEENKPSVFIVLHKDDKTRTRNSIGTCLYHIKNNLFNIDKKDVIVIFYNSGQTFTEKHEDITVWFAK